MIELPIVKTAPKVMEPRKLFMFSHPKVGKTHLISALPNSLIIDLEDSAEFYECASINVKRMSLEKGVPMLNILGEIATALIEKNKENGKPVYDFICIDTTTVLESIAREYATDLYKKTNMGKSFKGTDVVSELANGGGYDWLRMAFDKIYKMFTPLVGKCFILVGHVKTASINKEGKDLNAKDINLTGKLKTTVTSDSDAIGYLYRNKDTNENILSFKTTEQDLATGSRLSYLSGKEFVISRMTENGLENYWQEVFPSLK
jgi:hypothetical protein